MTITFLGTGTSQGVPVIGCACDVCRSLDFRDKRLRTSVHLQIGDQSIVIDTGPDFRQQMLRENIRRLDAVIFTHAHRDHTAGLDDVRAYNFMQDMDMPVFGTPATLDQLRTEYAYAFGKDSYPGIPRIDAREISERSFRLDGTGHEIIPLPVMHLNLPVYGYRFANFSYITDANLIPDSTFDRLKGTDVLVLNALQRDRHISHFNLEEALQIVARINPRKAYFTHISHRLGLHARVSNELPDHISLAFDGLQVTLD